MTGDARRRWAALLDGAARWSPLEVVDWIVHDGLHTPDMAAFVGALFERVHASGLPLARARVAIMTLHPLLVVRGCTWTPDHGAEMYEFGYGIRQTDAFIGSPIAYVREHGRPFRRRLENLDPERDHNVLLEAAAAGGTDYLAAPCRFSTGEIGATVSLVTTLPDGFDDDDLAHVDLLLHVLTPVLEVFQTRHAARSLLDTPPVCSPARTSLMTGRMPSQHGVHDFLSESPDFDRDWLADEILLPELLQLAGYRTALIGKWHCSATSLVPARGFDRWLSYDQGPADWPNQYLHFGTVYLSDQGSPISVEGFQLEHLGRAAREFIESGDPDQPYFLVFAPTDTHEPITGHPDALVEKYRNTELEDVPFGETSPFPAAYAAAVAPDDITETLAQYYAAVSHQDAELGKFLDLVETRGGLDNTLVIYTSDHGMMVGHHGLIGKSNATLPQNLYEESIRVPMILSWPGGFPVANVTLDLPFDHLDLFQTILDAAGVEVSSELQRTIDSPGRSLLPRLRHPQTEWRRYRFTEHGNARQISDGRYKLVRRYPPLDPRFGDELYDLDADPRESTNLIGSPEYLEIGTELGAALDAYYERFEVPEHSGRTVIDQPSVNGMEPWRKIADRLVQPVGN